MRPVTLFVYGSLMTGQAHHARLADARPLGDRRTAPSYSLVDLGRYPALLEGGGASVLGELYEVPGNTLASLDAFEDHPRLYARKSIRLEDGECAAAYVLVRTELARGRTVVAHGDWKRWLESRRAHQ